FSRKSAGVYRCFGRDVLCI
ncbi:integral membrane, YccS/YhfK family protein, partial [Vibrio parahaemolyticus EKP-021]